MTLRRYILNQYQQQSREINYLKCCLELEDYVYAVCIGVFEKEVKALGCIKFLNGIDHYRNREKMFANLSCKKYWALVEKSVYETFKKGKHSFIVK